MKYKIRYLPLADLDLMGIDAEISRFPLKAAKFFSLLDRQLKLLSDMPFMYPVYDDAPIYRKMVVLDYIVLYIVNDRKNTVDIHRVINGRMDIKRNLYYDEN